MKRYFRMWACRWNPIFFSDIMQPKSVSCHFLGGEYEAEVREGIYRCIAGTRVASVAADGSIGACLDIARLCMMKEIGGL